LISGEKADTSIIAGKAQKKSIFLARYKLIIEGNPMQSVFCATGTSRWERTQASAIPKMQGKPVRKFTFMSCCVSEKFMVAEG
jgi:hypothetical protein